MTPDRAGVFGGVDTHKQVHVAAAVDAAGRLLATAEFDAAPDGYGELAGWLQSWGAVWRVGVEGTGSYGAGLTRHLAAAGVEVVEVNRPNRQTRRRRGKSDTVDAEAAARAALSGEAVAVPKSADGCVEAIRTLSVARRCAVKARTVAGNQINAVAVTAPEQVKDLLRRLNTPQMIKICARWRLGVGGAPAAGAAKRALRALARRHQALTATNSTPTRCERPPDCSAAARRRNRGRAVDSRRGQPRAMRTRRHLPRCARLEASSAPEPAPLNRAATAKPTLAHRHGAAPPHGLRRARRAQASTRRETIRPQTPHRREIYRCAKRQEPMRRPQPTRPPRRRSPALQPTPPASQPRTRPLPTTATSPRYQQHLRSTSPARLVRLTKMDPAPLDWWPATGHQVDLAASPDGAADGSNTGHT